MTIFRLIAILFSLNLSACTTINKDLPAGNLDINSEHIFVTDYADFGPPQLSDNLLGEKHWQWDDPENHKPVTYKIKVVVYRDVDIQSVKKSFPVIPEIKQDYRYVQYKDAQNYFDNELNKFQQEMTTYDSPCDVGTMYIYPLTLYKTALAMERKLR
jgi:hypothetical protein